MVGTTESQNSVTVLIPCLNEAAGVGHLVRSIRDRLPQAQIIVVDNGSTDGTAKVSEAAGARVIHEPKRGKSAAVRSGLGACETDVVILVDGDGTYPVEGIRLVLDCYLDRRRDLIVGVRADRHLHRSLARAVADVVFSKLLRFCFGYGPKDPFSGLRLFSRRLYSDWPILGDGFDLEIANWAFVLDRKISHQEIPVPFVARQPGSYSKLKPLSDGVSILLSLVRLLISYRPLFTFSLLAFISGIAGLGFGLGPIMDYMRDKYVYRVPSAILAAALEILAVIFLVAGVILDAQLRVLKEFRFAMRSRKSFP